MKATTRIQRSCAVCIEQIRRNKNARCGKQDCGLELFQKLTPFHDLGILFFEKKEMTEVQPLAATKHVGYSATVSVVAVTARSADEPVSPSSVSVAAADEKLLELEASRRMQIKALSAALGFCFLFMICEVVGGYLSHSLAILTDATHLMTDVGAYALSIFALHAASRKACNKYSFGWHRAEVLGTLASVFMIWALVGAIVVEALSRVWTIVECSRVPPVAPLANLPPPTHHHQSPSPTPSSGASVLSIASPQCQEIDARMMIVIGVLGMVVNVVCASILHFGGSHGHSHFGGGTCGGGHDHGHGSRDDHHGHADDDHGHGSRDDHHGHADDDHGHGHDDHHGHGHDDHGHGHDDHGHAHDDHHGHAPTRPQFSIPHNDSHDEVLNNSYHTEDELGFDSPTSPGGTHRAAGSFALSAAFLHAIGDCVQSAGVILAGAFIYLANLRSFGKPSSGNSIYNLADPLSSIFFAVITLNMTRQLIGDILAILMESTPPGVDVEALTKALEAIHGVVSVHDLHVWSLAQNYPALSVHLVASNHVQALHAAQVICDKRFGITHTTIQVDSVEHGSDRCGATC